MKNEWNVYKNNFYKMKKDIGMADYIVKQEFRTPFLYLFSSIKPLFSAALKLQKPP